MFCGFISLGRVAWLPTKTRPFVGECDDGHFGRSAFGQRAILFVQSFLCSPTDFYDSSAAILLTRPEGYANPQGVDVLPGCPDQRFPRLWTISLGNASVAGRTPR